MKNASTWETVGDSKLLRECLHRKIGITNQTPIFLNPKAVPNILILDDFGVDVQNLNWVCVHIYYLEGR